MIGYLGYRAVRSVYQADQKRAAVKRNVALPPLWASVFVIPAVLLLAFLPSHGGVIAFLLIPLILGVFLTGGFIAFQCHVGNSAQQVKKAAIQKYAQPVTHAPAPVSVPQPGILAQYRTAKSAPVPRTDTERDRRVQDLFKVGCQQKGCYARYLAPCTPVKGVPLIVVDRGGKLFCHMSRIKDAVDSGKADRAEVVAQFGGVLPEGLNL